MEWGEARIGSEEERQRKRRDRNGEGTSGGVERMEGKAENGMEAGMGKRMEGRRTAAEERDGYPKLYTTKEIVGILKVSADTVYRKIQSGELPKPLPFSRLLRWNGHEFDRWVEDGCPGMKRDREKRGVGKKGTGKEKR